MEDYSEYLIQGEPDKRDRVRNWMAAIGLQDVDGLTPSNYMLETVRRYLPRLHSLLVVKGRNLPFYLWLVALSLAIAMTSRAIAHSSLSIWVMAGIAAVSLVCCIVQFAFGRFIGRRNGEVIAGGQSLGQKNTVFAIWFACTFLTPVTAIAGGFYSLWHNLVNTWQLYKHNHVR